jgi:hypothetical protein
MQITGASQPGCCDFFKYEVKALAVRGPYADFDLSGSIDTSDLNVLVANIGMRSGATFAQGDADDDADIDGNDFLVWQRQVGAATSLAEFDGLGQEFGTVPEPGAAVLVLCALMPSVFGRVR